MNRIKQLKMNEQLLDLRNEFEILLEKLSEQENIADRIIQTYGKIHNLKSNLFLIERNRSLKLTYMMEQHFDKIRKGQVQLSEEILGIFLICTSWVETDLNGDAGDEKEFEKILVKLKKMDTAVNASPLENWNLSSDEKALLRDARNSGLCIFLIEAVGDENLTNISDSIKEVGMEVLRIPLPGKKTVKIVFISDRKQRKLGKVLKAAVPFDEDLYLTSGDHKILIIEDNPVAMLLQKTIMSEFGICDTVPDGESGLELFRLAIKEGSPYSIILLDLVMPGMNGEEVLKSIRSEEAESRIKGLDRCKVIVSTTTEDSAVLMNLFRAEADAYIIKPLTRDKIHKEMKNLKLN